MANAKARTRTTVTQRRSNASKPAAAVLTPEQEAAEAELPKLREANKRKRDDAIARPLRDRILASKPQPGTDDYVRAVVALAQDERDQIEKAIRHDLETQQDRTPEFSIPVEGQNGTRHSIAYPPPTSAEALARDYVQAADVHRLWHDATDDLERRNRSPNAAQIEELAEAHRALLTDAIECTRRRRRGISDEVSDRHCKAVLQAQRLIRSGALLPQGKPAQPVEERTAVYIGKRKVKIGTDPPIVVSEKFDEVLVALLELGGSADTRQLRTRSGRDNFKNILRSEIDGKPELKPFFIFPGRKNQGGYRTTIQAMRQKLAAESG